MKDKETVPAPETDKETGAPGWRVVNAALGDAVLVSSSDIRRHGGMRFLWEVQAAGPGTGYGLFRKRDAETVAAFCNLMAQRTGPSNWIGAFRAEEVRA